MFVTNALEMKRLLDTHAQIGGLKETSEVLLEVENTGTLILTTNNRNHYFRTKLKGEWKPPGDEQPSQGTNGIISKIISFGALDAFVNCRLSNQKITFGEVFNLHEADIINFNLPKMAFSDVNLIASLPDYLGVGVEFDTVVIHKNWIHFYVKFSNAIISYPVNVNDSGLENSSLISDRLILDGGIFSKGVDFTEVYMSDKESGLVTLVGDNGETLSSWCLPETYTQPRWHPFLVFEIKSQTHKRDWELLWRLLNEKNRSAYEQVEVFDGDVYAGTYGRDWCGYTRLPNFRTTVGMMEFLKQYNTLSHMEYWAGGTVFKNNDTLIFLKAPVFNIHCGTLNDRFE